MPYIITTRAPNFPAEAGHTATRRAVATLEEVERETGHVFGNEGGRWTRPDQTVIAVERVAYNHLRWEAGWTPSVDDEDYSAAHRHGAEVVSAFNAMEADRAA